MEITKTTKLVHISTIKAGDTIIHNGKESTVGKKDITIGGFMGTSVFGDNYRSGTRLVEIVLYVKMSVLTIEQAKNAIKNDSCIDFHYPDDKPNTWRWMKIVSLDDEETGIYYKINGCGYPLFQSFENIIVDKIG